MNVLFNEVFWERMLFELFVRLQKSHSFCIDGSDKIVVSLERSGSLTRSQNFVGLRKMIKNSPKNCGIHGT